MSALEALAWLSWGACIGLVFGAGWGYWTRDREARAENKALAAKADAALRDVAADLAEALPSNDWALWRDELRRP